MWLCGLLWTPTGATAAVLCGKLAPYVALLVALGLYAEGAAHQAAVTGALGWSASLPQVWPLAFFSAWALVLLGAATWALASPDPSIRGIALLTGVLAVGPTIMAERLGVDVLDEVVARWPPDPSALRWWERPFAFARIARSVGRVRARLLPLARETAQQPSGDRCLGPDEVNRAIIDLIGPEVAQHILPNLWSDIEALAYEVSRGQTAMAELAVKQVCASLERRWQELLD